MSATIQKIDCRARKDLQASYVQVIFEFANSFQGTQYLTLAIDQYPVVLPTDPEDQFKALVFTVNLQGTSISVLKASLVCDPISPTEVEWWLRKHPQYRPFNSANPADADNKVASFSIDAASVQRSPTDSTEPDHGYTNVSRSKSIPTFTGFKSQHITVSVSAQVIYRNGQKPLNVTLTYNLLSTNATTGNFSKQQITLGSEPEPVGLAKQIYDAIAVLQYEGQVDLQEEECSGQLLVGQLFNITGTNSSDWGAMAAQVQEVEENLDTGQTAVRFGPPKHLSAGELVDLLRVNRNRFIGFPFSGPIDGTPGGAGGDLDITGDTPEKNSSHGEGPTSTHVVSGNVEGTGATLVTTSDEDNVSSVWDNATVPGGGSVTISLSDVPPGVNLKVQAVPVCQNGVSGIIYFLCSNFIPDP